MEVKGLTQLWKKMMEGDYVAHKKGPLAVLEPGGSWSLSFFCAVQVEKWHFAGSILQPPC